MAIYQAMDRRTSAASLRRLHLSHTLAWTLAWVLGVVSIAAVAAGLSTRLHVQDLDTELALYATATYGLTYFDDDGAFHDEIFRLDSDLVEGPADIWVVEPSPEEVDGARVLMRPPEQRFTVTDLTAIATRVVDGDEKLTLDGHDASGLAFRLYAMPTYADHAGAEPRAAVIVVASPTPGRVAHRAFVRKLLTAAAFLGLLGIPAGAWLARWSLRPIGEGLRQRERFLNAAAHELRTPLATLRSVFESAQAGDETATAALERLGPIVKRASRMADDLLLFARLDAGTTAPERQRLRLDLLVEAQVPEDGAIILDPEPTVIHGDPRLLAVVVRNLIDNARTHGHAKKSDGGGVRITVRDGSVVVEDRGPGFPPAILALDDQQLTLVPSRGGTGLGLMIARLITRLHDGHLTLENRSAGGARAILKLPVS